MRSNVWKYARIAACSSVALTVTGLLTAACSGSSSTPPATPAPGAPRVLKSTFDPAVVAANKTMAAGVPIGDSAAPVETRFDLGAVPAPGVPFVVQVAILPGAPAPLLRLDVTAAEGLSILSPDGQLTREKVTAGSVVPLEIRAESTDAGSRVLYIKATLELPDGPQARTFAFPILVAPGAPAPARAPAAKAPGPAKSSR
jgi:hypothetical protein